MGQELTAEFGICLTHPFCSMDTPTLQRVRNRVVFKTQTCPFNWVTTLNWNATIMQKTSTEHVLGCEPDKKKNSVTTPT